MLKKTIDFEELQLDIYFPREINLTDAYHLLYVLDGDDFGSIFSEVFKLQSEKMRKTKVLPTIIVSINHNVAQDKRTDLRTFRFTNKEKINKNNNSNQGGGLPKFIDQLKRIHKVIQQNYHIDASHIGLYGHSLGGLCVLEGLYSNQLPFVTHFVAVSPSLWWDQEMFFEKIPQIKTEDSVQLFLLVGRLEPKLLPLVSQAFHDIQKTSLKSHTQFYIAEGENHLSVVFQTMSRVFRWLA